MSAPPNYTNVTLMKAMGVKKYDPMPTDQHQWQRAEGEPLIHRIWSELCACSIMARLIGGRLVTTPSATEDDGVAPLTLVRLAERLGEDASNVRQAWKRGEELGIWRRESGQLWLNPKVTAVQIKEAKEERKKVCTHLLTNSDLLKIKGWPKERREEFQGLWNEVHAYEQARIAEATGRERDACAPVKDNIKTHFGLEIRHIQTAGRREPAVPARLLEFVQTAAYTPENEIVHTAASLLPAENTQRSPAASSKGMGVPLGERSETAPDRKKVSNVPIALPPDIAAAETQRRQTPEPSSMGGEQSWDHDKLVADPAAYASAVRTTAAEAGVGLIPADAEVIEAWRRDKVPLQTVRRALFLGALRQFISAVNRGGNVGVRSLHYFETVLAEVRETDVGAEYWEHNEAFLKRQRQRFGAQSKAAGGGM